MPITRYRRKPVEVEALQYTGDNAKEIQAFTGYDFDEWEDRHLLNRLAVRSDNEITWHSEDELKREYEPLPTPSQSPAPIPSKEEIAREICCGSKCCYPNDCDALRGNLIQAQAEAVVRLIAPLIEENKRLREAQSPAADRAAIPEGMLSETEIGLIIAEYLEVRPDDIDVVFVDGISGASAEIVRRIALSAAPPAPETGWRTIDVVFDGPPSNESGRFVEVECDGRSVNVGEWVQRGDGYWALRFEVRAIPAPPAKGEV